MRARKVAATDAAEQYLASLLGEFARGTRAGESADRPLTLLLGEALESSGAERFQRLQNIGDGVLYAVGFFGDAFEKRGADPHYAMSVGSSAYGHAAAMLRLTGSGAGPDVLAELARSFERFVAVVMEVADALFTPGVDDDTSVLRLYRRWERTGSERLADALAVRGVCPVRAIGGVH
ncbi:MAG: hypothetical protein EXR75_15735 [Myxococcales bacterium]|nr:hypothetical protein [Myxococcales bacterium]